jgi:hypothetical protein
MKKCQCQWYVAATGDPTDSAEKTTRHASQELFSHTPPRAVMVKQEAKLRD